MSDISVEPKRSFDLDLWARYARLASGLILFTFALTHLLDHSLGLISVDVMESVQQWRMAVTRHPVGTTILYGALITHVFLALAKTATRHALRLPAWELLQLALGIIIPLLLIMHLADTRASEWLIDFDDRYRNTIPGYWPKNVWLPIGLVIVVWSHGCMGLHFWLRLKSWYRRSFQLWFALALIIPCLAIGGFLAAGQSIADERKIKRLERAAMERPQHAALNTAPLRIVLAGLVPGGVDLAPTATTTELWVPVAKGDNDWSYGLILEYADTGRWMFAAFALLALMTPGLAYLYRRRGAKVSVLYPDQRVVRAIRGASLLEISRQALGIERQIVVMFADLRGFTSFSEDKLPYDTVFFLNEYFAQQEAAITRHGGRVDKFMGDGIMALFGAEDVFDPSLSADDCSDICTASKGALNALTDMLESLGAMNRDERLELTEPLRLAIGLHAGPAVLGDMGAGQARRPTAIGDVVNAAARLESLAKEWDTPVVASTDVLREAGWGYEGFEPVTVEVRGKQNTVDVVRLDDPAALSS